MCVFAEARKVEISGHCPCLLLILAGKQHPLYRSYPVLNKLLVLISKLYHNVKYLGMIR